MKDSFVSMEIKICPICGVEHSNNSSILISKNLKPIKKENTITGYELCEEHEELFENGYLCLIAVSNDTSSENETLNFEDAERTGKIAHIKKYLTPDIFDIEIDPKLSFIFVDEEVINVLENKLQESDNNVLH